jgi:hypothetical protein
VNLRLDRAGTQNAISESMMMELLGRLGAAIGISLVLTLLMLVLYQDDSAQMQIQPDSTTITQAVAATTHGTP